jgi:hypothetical protein
MLMLKKMQVAVMASVIALPPGLRYHGRLEGTGDKSR